MDKKAVAARVIELNRDCTCSDYYYSNVVLYNYVIWRVQGRSIAMFEVGG